MCLFFFNLKSLDIVITNLFQSHMSFTHLNTLNHQPVSHLAYTAHTHTTMMAAQRKLYMQPWVHMPPSVYDSPNNHRLNIRFPSSPTHPAPTVQGFREMQLILDFPAKHQAAPSQSATAWSGLLPAQPWVGMNYVKTLAWHLHIKMGWTLQVHLPTAAMLLLLIGFAMGYCGAEQNHRSTTHAACHCSHLYVIYWARNWNSLLHTAGFHSTSNQKQQQKQT